MATDYDAPRKNDDDAESLDAIKERIPAKTGGTVDVDEAELAWREVSCSTRGDDAAERVGERVVVHGHLHDAKCSKFHRTVFAASESERRGGSDDRVERDGVPSSR